jgi:RNA polymerase sigma-70 factor (ECF subfamily)
MRHPCGDRARLDDAELATLLGRIAAGDERAFDLLYRMVSPRLNALALYLTRSPPQADEALQEAFASIWFRASTYRPEAGAAFPWMVTILRNRVIALYRGKRLELVPLAEADRVACALALPDHCAAVSEAGRRIAELMATLSPNIRRSVQLAFFHGADYHEIAAEIGVPVNTAKSWVRRGMLRLQRAMVEAAPTDRA